MWRASGSLKEGRHGGHDLDGGRVDAVAAVKRLFPVRCCVCLCVTILPLPLSDRVMVTKMLKKNMMMSLLLIKYC